MTIFGLLWFLSMVYAFSRKDRRIMAFFTLLFMCFQCVSVIVLPSGLGIGPQVLSSLCLIINALFRSKFKIRRNKNGFFTKAILLILVIVIIFSTYLAGNLFDKTMYIFQLIIYIVTFIFIGHEFRNSSQEEIYTYIRKLIVIITVIGVIQWFTTIGLLPIKPLLKVLLYNEEKALFFNYSYSNRVFSTFMESSYYAGFVVGAFFYLFSFSGKYKKNWLLLVVLMIQIILTQSSTAYGAFLVGGAIMLVFSKTVKLKTKILVLGFAVVGIIILYVGFYDLLDVVIFSKSTSSSGRTRAMWNISAFEVFLKNPVLGVGYKNIRASSLFYSILGELGILGLSLYCLFNISIVWRAVRKKDTRSFGMYGVALAIIINVACQIIACPDLDLCTYWLWAYIASIYLSNRSLNIDGKVSNAEVLYEDGKNMVGNL